MSPSCVHDRCCDRTPVEAGELGPALTSDSPGGTIDHSPPFQRWVPSSDPQTEPRQGRKKVRTSLQTFFRPWRDWFAFLPLHPSDKSLGYDLPPFGLGLPHGGSQERLRPPLTLSCLFSSLPAQCPAEKHPRMKLRRMSWSPWQAGQMWQDRNEWDGCESPTGAKSDKILSIDNRVRPSYSPW